MTTDRKPRIAGDELRELNSQGWSPAELAIHFECPAKAVEDRLKRLGLDANEGLVLRGK